MKRISTVVLTILVIWQGGFHDMAWLICGALAAIYLVVRTKMLPPKPILILLLSLTFAYGVSAVLHGARLEGLMSSVKPMVVLLVIAALYNCNPDIEVDSLIAGLVAALTGILAFCGLLPLPGMIIDGRLNGVFQYANSLALFLGVCALVTRLSGKRAHFASLMETTLLLTGSVGGIAVYLAGLLFTYILNKQDRPIFQLQAASLIATGICAASMFMLARWVAPYCAVLPPIAIYLLHKPLEKLQNQHWLPWASIGLVLAAVSVLLAIRGAEPLITYTSRLVQMSDGVKTLFSNPLGIGPGAWPYEFHARQTTYYDAAIIHSGFVSAGVDAGWPALIMIVVMIIWYLRKRPFPRYSGAVGMILFHTLFDISMSFLSIVFLLCLLVASELPAERASDRRIKAVWAVPCIICFMLAWPQGIKNQAKWAADAGEYDKAVNLLEASSLRSDTQAQLLRLRCSLISEQQATVKQSLEALGGRNTDACYLIAFDCLRRGGIREAAKWTELCIQNAPYALNGYKLAEEVMMKMGDGQREAFSEKIETIKTSALAHMHPLAKYIPSDEGLR